MDYSNLSELYAKKSMQGTIYLAFRDVPLLLLQLLSSTQQEPIRLLDYGCGAGFSTRYLKSLQNLFISSLQIDGVDISEEMLKQARQIDSINHYKKITDGKIAAPDKFYQGAFSSFVLYEFATKQAMQEGLEEVKRVLIPGGFFIVVVGSVESYCSHYEWVSLKTHFPQNAHLKSGDLARVDLPLKEGVLTFQNYYWTEQDYQEVFKKAGFNLVHTYYPLGLEVEEDVLNWKWKSEKIASPYYLFILT